MGDNTEHDVLVERLHLLRARSGLSTVQLATRCGIPKSSMESYLRLKNPKRPGIDALIAISEAMNVSLDWLAGRADDDGQTPLYSRDYAIGCFNMAMALLHWIRQAHDRDPANFIAADTIAGREDAEIAARSMVEFIEAMHSYSPSADTWGPARKELSERLEASLPQSETGN